MNQEKLETLYNLPVGYKALVQGGSRGIGLGFVNALLNDSRCDHVFASCRNPESAEELKVFAQKYPKQLSLLSLDLSSEESIQGFGTKLRTQTDQLHLVLNVSGLLHHKEGGIFPEKRFESCSLQAMRAVFEINSFGPMLIAKEVVPLLKHSETSIFASLSARVGSISDNRLGGWYSYRASKAALNMFSKTLSIELARRAPNTIVTCLHPGTTDTDLSAPFQRNVPPEKLFSVQKTVHLLCHVLSGLSTKDNGSFLAWDGTTIEW